MKKTTRITITVCALALLGAFVHSRPAAALPTTDSDPAATHTAKPAEQPSESTSGLTLKRLLVATGVSEREPVGSASEFAIASTTHLYAFVELANPNPETTVHVTWVDTDSGKERKPFALQIGTSKRWRSWARIQTPKQPGNFALVVEDEAGIELGRTPFKVM